VGSALKGSYCKEQILGDKAPKSIGKATAHERCAALFEESQKDRNSSESESSVGMISWSNITDGGPNVKIQLIFTVILAISGFYFLIFSRK
jgi:hypothetical protein